MAVSFVLLYILQTHCERKSEQVGMGIILSLSKLSKMTTSVCCEVSVHSDLGFFLIAIKLKLQEPIIWAHS